MNGQRPSLQSRLAHCQLVIRDQSKVIEDYAQMIAALKSELEDAKAFIRSLQKALTGGVRVESTDVKGALNDENGLAEALKCLDTQPEPPR